HLGHYHCSSCNYRRPEPDIKLTGRRINSAGTAVLQISLPNKKMELAFPLMGTYNLYNLLAAVTCAQALSIPAAVISQALEKAVPSFGRMETFKLNSKTIIMALIKNPVGANEVLRTILTQKDNIAVMMAINDKIADGTDVSWLWDVDFEQLSAVKDKLSAVLVSGLRAWDMAVRFKYAGFNPDQIQLEEETNLAINKAIEKTPPGGLLFILPTYTAMLEIRRTLNKMGLGKPYWED
ncbi:MAG: MurT ligase domain-containing protein, partial [Clostridia bacterium]|nr:MurT ligase domain-containing protein [Clostridia bacterium]